MNFNQLFKQISPEEISDNVFTLAGKVFPVVTVGKYVFGESTYVWVKQIYHEYGN